MNHQVQQDRRSVLRHGLQMAVVGSSGLFAVAGSGQPVILRRRESIERISAHKLEKIEAAIEEMMARSKKDPLDPKGWLVNAEPHNAFCAAPGSGGAKQIHFSYWFLPWHRAYLLITERKIRELAKDPSLALPYWNWSSTPRIPERFAQSTSPLSKAVRYTPARDLHASEIDYLQDDPERSKWVVGALAATRFLATANRDPVKLARSLADSFGGLVRPNEFSVYANSRIEGTPHGPVHVYVGGRSASGSKVGDMSDFSTAARDPLFFGHHCNLDRLWEIWRSNPKNRAQEPTTSDFLSRRFTFPWLDGSVVEVSVQETLDAAKLGYEYDNLAVLEPGVPAPRFQAEAAAPRALRPIARKRLALPATPEAAGIGQPRYTLVLEGLESPRRPLSAGVYVARAGAAGILVGSIAVVKSGDEFGSPAGALVFDITNAVATLQTRQLEVTVVPNAIGGEAGSPYRALRFRSMRIIPE